MAKKLLLTGFCGFVGSHIVEGILKQTNWEIVGLDAITYAGNLNRLTDMDCWEEEKHRVKIVWHDLRSPLSETIHKMIGQVDYVWHLAAESHVQRSLEDAVPFAMSNVVGTTNLLEYLRKYQTEMERYIYFSTDEVFGPAPEGVFHDEGHVQNPSNPYSASKEGAEAMSKAFAFSHGLPTTITRTMNIFGERQHPEKFLPMVVGKIKKGETVTIHGLPGKISQRCWIHARNVCSALLWINKNGEFIRKDKQDDPQWGAYHIVGDERDVKQLADLIGEIMEVKPEYEYVDYHKTRPGHDHRYALSGKKLKEAGFEYPFTLEASFEKMVRWMIEEENKKWLE